MMSGARSRQRTDAGGTRALGLDPITTALQLALLRPVRRQRRGSSSGTAGRCELSVLAIFGSFAALFALTFLNAAPAGARADRAGPCSWRILFAQPFLVLRLIGQIRPVARRSCIAIAFLGAVAAWEAIVLVPPIAATLGAAALRTIGTLFAVLYFFVVEIARRGLVRARQPAPVRRRAHPARLRGRRDRPLRRLHPARRPGVASAGRRRAGIGRLARRSRASSSSSRRSATSARSCRRAGSAGSSTAPRRSSSSASLVAPPTELDPRQPLERPRLDRPRDPRRAPRLDPARRRPERPLAVVGDASPVPEPPSDGASRSVSERRARRSGRATR